MNAIIRGTTPTIKYTFNDVQVSTITAAYMTVQMGGRTLFEKELSDDTTGTNYIAWTLTQAETISMTGEYIMVMLNWLTDSGTRGASAESKFYITSNMKEVVI